jgi:RNA polymerase sigma-70 factor (ECF subfamily)
MGIKSLDNVCQEKIYASVYNKYAEDINKFFYYKYGNAINAEESVQEAFIKLWENCKTVPVEKAKSFLFTVANNLSINKLKHEKVKLKYVNHQVHKTEDHQDPAYKMEEEEFKKKLNSAINNLKPKLRSTFLMHRIDGKSYKEIAEIENKTVKAIEKRMSQALSQLREHIENI